ncbi:macro domain-containing protein [Petrocella sp. FN5]|uniref:macro domain-containing protein n=1 Tax=Petrocella sp. FN5 TaxID=3032002 RepID=UPI0023DAEB75|nr:macro domain-containing protein [Petrocella sp. FN5]MDF1616775.1 macro domain-containing protein [Petrocella sp. FN5]
MIKFELIKGELLEQKVDAILNLTNQNLDYKGGLNDFINKYAGENLEKECGELGGCSTGKAKMTMSYDLEAKGIGWIIHAVGPRYAGGMYFEDDLLADTYQAALMLTVNYKKHYMKQCLDVLDKYIGHLEASAKISYTQDTKSELMDYFEHHPIKSIALQSISTGAYGYPIEEAAKIAIRTIKAFCSDHEHLEKILMVCQDENTYEAFKKYC